ESKYSPNIKLILCQTAEILRAEDEFLDALAKEAMYQCIESDNNGIFKSPLTPLCKRREQIQPLKKDTTQIPPLKKDTTQIPPLKKGDQGGFLDKITIRIDNLKKHHVSIQRRIIRIAIESILGDLNRYEFHHIDKIISLIETGKTGSSVSLPRGIIAEKSYGKMIIKLDEGETTETFDFVIKVPGETEIPSLGLKIITLVGKGNDYSKEIYQKTFDYDVIEGELHLRNRRKGDRFQPLGISNKKKLKEYFIDEKIPRSQRDKIPILTDGNKIMWVVGYNIDDRFKVTTQTKTHLNVTVSFLQPPE
ncbi:MAG: tRNA lysidine(34) synthetase TilS, partial [Candidatus Poribacteria bacterium]